MARANKQGRTVAILYLATLVLLGVAGGWLAIQGRGDMALAVVMGIGLFSSALLIAFEPWLNAYQLAEPRCLACGYDLRATPKCCPECGATVASAAGNHAREAL